MDWVAIIEKFGLPTCMCLWFMWRSRAIDQERRAERTENWAVINTLSDRIQTLALANTVIVREMDMATHEERKLLAERTSSSTDDKED